MVAKKAPPRDPQDVGPPPPTTPGHASSALGSGDHSFTLQAVMELHKTVGELKSSIDGLKASVDSTKARVDDLVNWKNRILGGAIAVGALLSIFSFLVAKFSDYIEIRSPQAPAVSPVPPAPTSVVPAPKR